MFQRSVFPVVIVSAVLLIYCVLIGFGISLPLAFLIFAVSPLLLGWMSYTVIRYGVFSGRELGQDEEWAYGDKTRDELDAI